MVPSHWLYSLHLIIPRLRVHTARSAAAASATASPRLFSYELCINTKVPCFPNWPAWNPPFFSPRTFKVANPPPVRMSESTLPSPSQLHNADPTTPAFDDDVEWITAYLKIHALSHTTWRYAHFLWLAIGLVSVAFALSHLLDLRSGIIGAYWSKWSLRRRTWRKKHSLSQAKKSGQAHKQPLLLPSNAQLLTLSAIIIGSLGLTFLGPDYIAPSHRLFHRAAAVDVAAYIPQHTIQKAWWASGNRAGLIAFALFPLCILFALKRAPFAIFAIPFFTNIHSDKLIWLHRWIGRFIWALIVLHASLWSVQLFRDKRVDTGGSAYVYAWTYQKFIFAWTVSIHFRIICNLE